MIWAELFLLASGALIGMGLLLGAVAAVAYFMGTLDD
jgi:hypothetical protein